MTTHDQFTESTRSPAQARPHVSEPDALSEQAETLTRDPRPVDAQSDPMVTDGHPGAATDPDRTLFADDQLAGLRARWDSVQAGFVDDPRDCVHRADGLVSEVVDQLTTGFSDARSRLEAHWARGEEPSTEDLRVALKGYREFFERLLAV